MNIGIILARKGSKRLPGKNTKIFAGVPLVEWTIMEAMLAESLDRVIVSTDDMDVAKIAFACGTMVHPRPQELCGDDVTSYEVLNFLIRELGLFQDVIVLLQPTSPLRIALDIDRCVKLAHTMADRICISVEEGKTEGNGAIYVAHASWIMVGGNWDLPGPYKYEMPPARSHDIDTIEDFQRAEGSA